MYLRAVPGHVMHVALQIPTEFPRESHTVTVYEEKTVTVKVTGKIWVYRPQLKP